MSIVNNTKFQIKENLIQKILELPLVASALLKGYQLLVGTLGNPRRGERIYCVNPREFIRHTDASSSYGRWLWTADSRPGWGRLELAPATRTSPMHIGKYGPKNIALLLNLEKEDIETLEKVLKTLTDANTIQKQGTMVEV